MYQREQDQRDIFNRPVKDGDIIVFATSVVHLGHLRVAIVLDAKQGKVRSMMKSFYSTEDVRLSDRNASIVSFNKAMVMGAGAIPAFAYNALLDFYNKYKEAH